MIHNRFTPPHEVSATTTSHSDRQADLRARQSEVISTLRFPLTVAVLFIHVLSFAQAPFTDGDLGHNVYVFISELMSHQLFAAVVPCFFVISGYYLFYSGSRPAWDMGQYLPMLRKRAQSLLLPYLLWNLLFILLIYLKGLLSTRLGLVSSDQGLLREHSIGELLLMPVNFPLWYIRDLICVTLITPVYYYLLRYLPRWGGAGLLLCIYIADCGLSMGLSTTAVCYFGLGAYTALHGGTLLGLARPLWRFTLPGWLLLSSLAIFWPELPLPRVAIPLGVVSLIGLMDALIDHLPRVSALCRRLLPTTFFVYALHMVYIEPWIKGAYARTPLAANGWGLLVGYFLIPIATLCVCLLAYYVLRRGAPRLLALLCGGRA